MSYHPSDTLRDVVYTAVESLKENSLLKDTDDVALEVIREAMHDVAYPFLIEWKGR